MLEFIKPTYNRALKPLAKYSPHPNIITTIGLLFFIMGGYFTAIGSWYIAFTMGIIGGIADGLDGVVAREKNLSSKFGALFDSVTDRLTEIVWFAGLTYFFATQKSFDPLPIFFIFAAITGSLTVSYVRARAEGLGVDCSKGIMQRTERLLFLGILLLLGPTYMKWGLLAVAILAYITVIQRVIITFNNLRNK